MEIKFWPISILTAKSAWLNFLKSSESIAKVNKLFSSLTITIRGHLSPMWLYPY